MTSGYPGSYPPPHPQPAPGPPATKPQTKWYRRTWAIAAGTAIVGLGIGAAAGGGKTESAQAGARPAATESVTATVTAPAPPAGTRTLQPTVVKTIATKTKTETETYTPPPQPSFSDGTYEVGSDIKAGTFRTDGGASCYYAVLNDVGGGGIDDIVNNSNFSGPSIAKLKKGQYFEVSGGCEWHRK